MNIPLLYKDKREEGNTPTRKAQLIELHLLECLRAVCDRYGLRFYLAYGTLLGALRHGGFIPWDDDCDVFMLREDFDRFISIAGTALPEDVYLEMPVDNVRMENSLVRLRDNYSIGIAKHNRRLLVNDHLGVSLDIFVLDKANRKNAFSMWSLHKYCSDTGWMRRSQYNDVTILNLMVKWCWYIKVGIEWLLWKISQSFCQDEWLIPSTWYLAWKQWYKKSWFSSADQEPRMVVFEGVPFPVPREAELVLSTTYGDWRSPPPNTSRTGYYSIVLPDTPCFHSAAMKYPENRGVNKC